MKIIVGLLLTFAVCFKTLWLYSDPVVLQQPDWAQVLLPFEIAIEIGIGILALFGGYWQKVRWVAISLFSGFAVYSFYLALEGADSCGCFGPIKVNPWTTFGLDVLIVAGLVAEWWRKGRKSSTPGLSPGYRGKKLLENPSPSLSPVPARREGEGLLKLAGIGGVSLALFFVLLWQTRPDVQADGLVHTMSGLTILEPTVWSGQPFPLVESIDIDLSRGEWLVVLHRHDCHDCQEAVPLYEELAREKRVALIEVPPFAEEQAGNSSVCVQGRLTADHEWFVQTPVEIRLRDGVVVAASTELPGLGGLKRQPVASVAFQERFEHKVTE